MSTPQAIITTCAFTKCGSCACCSNFSFSQTFSVHEGISYRVLEINLLGIIKLKNRLANVEALEGELTSALNVANQYCTTHNINYYLFLEKCWVEEENNLKKLVCEIIDPFAVTQVRCKIITLASKNSTFLGRFVSEICWVN